MVKRTLQEQSDSSLEGRADSGAVVPAAARQAVSLPSTAISQVPHTSVRTEEQAAKRAAQLKRTLTRDERELLTQSWREGAGDPLGRRLRVDRGGAAAGGRAAGAGVAHLVAFGLRLCEHATAPRYIPLYTFCMGS